jgi:sarcosine oxidase subunit beta
MPEPERPEFTDALGPADFVIIGGGVHGAGLAWRLAERGADVLLVEKNTVASGASGGRGKRGVRANMRVEAELPLSALAMEMWPELESVLGAPTGYERTGMLHLFETAAERESMVAQAALQNRFGIPTRVINQDELLALEPNLAPIIIGALYGENDGVADHTSTTYALARAARRLGARVRQSVTATGFRVAGGRVAAVVTDQGEVEVRRDVAILANAGTLPLVGQLGAAFSTFDVWPQGLITEPLDPMPVKRLVAHIPRRLNTKPLPDGRLMITGGWLGELDPNTGCGVATPRNIQGNVESAVAVYPSLAGVTIEEAFAERADSVGPSGLPVIDRLIDLNVVIGAGWTGTGFAIAPAVSRLLTSWLLDGVKPLELAPFSLR